MRKVPTEDLIKGLFNSLFLDGYSDGTLDNIVEMWLSRRLIAHQFSVFDSPVYGDRAVVLKDPRSEYKAIFTAIATLKCYVSVGATSVSLFRSPLLDVEKEGLLPVDDVLSIPLNSLSYESLKALNYLVKNKRFKTRTVARRSYYCVFSNPENAGSFSDGSEVNSVYKSTILSSVVNFLLKTAVSDSMRFTYAKNNSCMACDRRTLLYDSSKRNTLIECFIMSVFTIIEEISYEIESVLVFILQYSQTPDYFDSYSFDSKEVKNHALLCASYKNAYEKVKNILLLYKASYKITISNKKNEFF